MKNKTTLSELKHFLILWSSQAISTLGTSMTNFALIIWVYGQKGTATSITMLSICSFLPSILFCFIAGTIADRWDKKRIMLAADLVAAFGTVTVFILYSTGSLQIWHLYIINFVLSFMNAFQNPASYVATSLLVPKEHYIRVSGLQALSGSVVTILAPALGSALLAFGGLKTVLYFDLATFSIAFSILLFFIKLPAIEYKEQTRESLIQSCMNGIRFLKEHTALLRIILFFTFINFISKMSSYGMLSPLILSRTGNNQMALGIVESAVGVGTLLGSILVTVMKPAKHRIRVIFISCGMSFLVGDVILSLTHTLPLWAAATFIANIPMAFLNANLTALMRLNIPIDMQGRVFSARDTIQYSTIPLGLLLGGILTDYVFEPFMAAESPLRSLLIPIFGTGKGSGMAIIFFIVGTTGTIASLKQLKNRKYNELES